MEKVKLSKGTKRRFTRKKYLEYKKRKTRTFIVKLSVFLLAFIIFIGINSFDSELNAKNNDQLTKNFRGLIVTEN